LNSTLGERFIQSTPAHPISPTLILILSCDKRIEQLPSWLIIK
jgi:hypothetical protein